MTGFEGQRIVITGAAGGVGQALTAAFAKLGGDVVACDVEGSDLTAPHIAEAHHFDLRDSDASGRAMASILSNGTPSIVVLNAGWAREETLEQTTAEGLIDEMNLNFTSSALLTHALLPQMRQQTGDRAFVFISSVNAFAHHGNPAYSAAKAATLAWMRALAVEEGWRGIRANAVVPGSIRTQPWDQRIERSPELMGKISALYPLGRLVIPDEVAAAVTFLASDAASGITGTTLNVDAGLAAGNLPFLDAIR
ncbi:MAG: NAD(P)-dependent dehydrogenase (short-subunit alcohol dehydrogenase family) [Granulosicoccus sp.]|jgi:NAD(P)-dependent dehydrogenase (short-subunit alcohol dehydrogenase family)